MLTPDERRQVIEELADFVGLTGDIRQFVRATLGVNQKDLLVDLPVNCILIPDQAAFVVDHCLQSRWKFTPSLLEMVLVRLVDNGKADLAPMRDRVRAGTDPNPSAYKTLWVLADQPFIDRKNLRARLEQLVEGGDRPILRVTGVRGSGKSYTSELLDYVMKKAREDVHVASATLTEGNGPSYDVAELAESLAVAFSPDETLPERRNSSYSSALGRWIVRNTLKKAGIWIYLLDGFGQQDVKDETRELVQLLAQYVCSAEYSRRLRLLLLDYDKPLTGNWRAKTVDDVLPEPSGIREQDLVDCLAEYNQRVLAAQKPQKAINPSEISTLAAALLQRASANPQGQLQQIYDELVALAQIGD